MSAATPPTAKKSARTAAFDAAMADARLRRRAGDFGASFSLLERAHVLGQRDIGRHLRVHLAMLRIAWTMKDWRELRGQILRFGLVPLGHLARRLPLGNTGASNVSAFAPMAVSSELEQLLDDRHT